MDSPEEIFGFADGKPNVVLDNSNGKAQDIVLSKCYRNSRPVLITAHSLGFGIYRKKEDRETTPLVQLFEDKKLWEDIGYVIKEGAIKDREPVTIYRTEESSPLFLETHSPIDDLIQFRRFDTAEQEAKWVVDDIEKNLRDEELKYQDIMIIHPYSHITLGGYKNCRIPADRPIAPIQFVKFIMEHFYYEPSSKLKFNFALESMITFEEHIAECDVIKSRVMV